MLSKSRVNHDEGDSPERKGTSQSSSFFSRPLPREVVLLAVVSIGFPVLSLGYRSQIKVFAPSTMEALFLSLLYVALLASFVFAFGVACRLLGKASTEVTASDRIKNVLALGVVAMLLLHIGHFDQVFWRFYGSSVDEIDAMLAFLKSAFTEIQGVAKN